MEVQRQPFHIVTVATQRCHGNQSYQYLPSAAGLASLPAHAAGTAVAAELPEIKQVPAN
jgi:hypothetical protein